MKEGVVANLQRKRAFPKNFHPPTFIALTTSMFASLLNYSKTIRVHF